MVSRYRFTMVSYNKRKESYYKPASRLDNMTVRKNGKVTRTLKGGELYTGIEAIKYNILHLLSPVDIEIEDTFTMNGRRYKKLI